MQSNAKALKNDTMKAPKAAAVDKNETIQTVAARASRAKGVNESAGDGQLQREFSQMVDKIASRLSGSADFAGYYFAAPREDAPSAPAPASSTTS